MKLINGSTAKLAGNIVTQKLLNKGMTQIRKKKLSIRYYLQDFNWMNNRGEFQTDTIVKCREAAFTPWGKDKDVELGDRISYLQPRTNRVSRQDIPTMN